MFYVFNKQKICSYLIASSTVAILLAVSIFFTGSKIETKETMAYTGSSFPICSVETNRQRISLTINCEWESNDIDKILETLDKCNVKATFFMVRNVY